jgi:uncharacterized membrane protein (DUF485 family)
MATIGYWTLLAVVFGAGVGFGFGLAMIVSLFVISLLYSTFSKMYFDE